MEQCVDIVRCIDGNFTTKDLNISVNDGKILLAKEIEKLKKDQFEYSYEEFLKEFTQKINKQKKSQSIEIKEDDKKHLYEAIFKYEIKPAIFDLNDDNEENTLKLKKEIRNNVKNAETTFYYISQARIKQNPLHWFLTVQKERQIYIIDSLGSYERDDFFRMFIEESEYIKKEYKLVYYRNSQRLQYSSGVCEVFAIKTAIYLARMQIFNTVSKFFKGIFIPSQDKGKPMDTLEPILEFGISEVAFGLMNDKIFFAFNRIKQIENQINRLEESRKTKPIKYSMKLSFQDVFIRDLKHSVVLLTTLQNKYMPNKSTWLSIVHSIINKNEKLKDINSKIIENIFDVIYEQRSIIIPNIEILPRLETYTQELSFGDIKQIILIVNDILYNRNKEQNVKTIKEELLNLHKIDFSNPYTSVKLGHMYFEALRYQQVLEDMRKNEEENYRNSNPETFRLGYI